MIDAVSFVGGMLMGIGIGLALGGNKKVFLK